MFSVKLMLSWSRWRRMDLIQGRLSQGQGHENFWTIPRQGTNEETALRVNWFEKYIYSISCVYSTVKVVYIVQ